MISEEEARRTLLDLVQPTEEIDVALIEGLHAYSAEDLLASVPIPGFDNSMMDGYALLAADSASPRPIRVCGEQPAGPDLRLTVEAGEAVRIFTGAPMPAGADAVIMQEDVDRLADATISCREPVVVGENVRRAGGDLCRGQRILSQGDLLSPARLALLASQGRSRVRIHRRPRVAVLSTGDELIAPGTDAPLADGQVYNSNGVMIDALCREQGILDTHVAHCTDDFTATVEMLRDLISRHDAVILSGGVSVGDHDHIRPALSALGIEPELWKVRVKPGKPFLFARSHHARPVAILGLPGNPVSSFVTFHLFVRPCLLRLMGAPAQAAAPMLETVTLAGDCPIINDGDRPHYVRGHLENQRFTPHGLQQSHALATLSQANALLRLEAGVTLEAGDCGVALKLPTR